jgi:hypothetical protein
VHMKETRATKTLFNPTEAQQLAKELLEDADVTSDNAPFMWSSGAARAAGELLRAACEEIGRLRARNAYLERNNDEERSALYDEREDLRARLARVERSACRHDGMACISIDAVRETEAK